MLATLVAVAMRLHESGAWGNRIAAITGSERRTVVTLKGPEAERDARRVKSASWLWREQFGITLRCVAPAPGDRIAALGLRYDQSLATAGQIILRDQLERLEACRQGVSDDDPEALHDARVAVRRMRTALRLLKRAYIGRELRPLLAGLKQAGDRLGAVRDLDVLLQRVREESLQLADPPALDGLLQSWEQQRREARLRLFEYLDGEEYQVWSERFESFIEAGGIGTSGGERVCDVLPRMIWQRYGVVRAYQPRVSQARPEELHELRKDAKQLRYLLEFFRELLRGRTAGLIKQIVAVQDALGEMHDSVVLSELIDKQIAERGTAAGIEEYRLRTLAAISKRRRAFEALWPDLIHRRFRKQLAKGTATV